MAWHLPSVCRSLVAFLHRLQPTIMTIQPLIEFAATFQFVDAPLVHEMVFQREQALQFFLNEEAVRSRWRAYVK